MYLYLFQLEESIVEYFVFELTDRISSGLFSLRQILSATLKQKQVLVIEHIFFFLHPMGMETKNIKSKLTFRVIYVSTFFGLWG